MADGRSTGSGHHFTTIFQIGGIRHAPGATRVARRHVIDMSVNRAELHAPRYVPSPLGWRIEGSDHIDLRVPFAQGTAGPRARRDRARCTSTSRGSASRDSARTILEPPVQFGPAVPLARSARVPNLCAVRPAWRPRPAWRQMVDAAHHAMPNGRSNGPTAQRSNGPTAQRHAMPNGRSAAADGCSSALYSRPPHGRNLTASGSA